MVESASIVVMADASTETTRDYPLSARVRARIFAALLLLVGVLLCAATALVALLRVDGDVLSVVVIVVVLVVVGAGWAVNRRTTVLRVDPTGYQVRLVRGVGTASARWSEVAELETAEVAGSRCVVLKLRGGGQTTIPVDVLATDPEQLVLELRERLSAASGER